MLDLPEVPAYLEGETWKFRAGCSVFISLFAVVFLIAAFEEGDRGLAAGLIILVLFMGVAAPIRLARTRFVQLRPEGITVHSFWRKRDIAWKDINDIDVKTSKTEGGTWHVPEICLRSGKSCRITALASMGSGNEATAQRSATTLLVARHAHLKL